MTSSWTAASRQTLPSNGPTANDCSMPVSGSLFTSLRPSAERGYLPFAEPRRNRGGRSETDPYPRTRVSRACINSPSGRASLSRIVKWWAPSIGSRFPSAYKKMGLARIGPTGAADQMKVNAAGNNVDASTAPTCRFYRPPCGRAGCSTDHRVRQLKDQSFNCGYARHSVERAICQEPMLRQLDRRAVSPGERKASNRLTSPLSPNTRQARCGWAMPASCCGPSSSRSNGWPICRRVASAIISVVGVAKACRRAARFGVSPTTPRSCAAPSPLNRRPRPAPWRCQAVHVDFRTLATGRPLHSRGRPAPPARHRPRAPADIRNKSIRRRPFIWRQKQSERPTVSATARWQPPISSRRSSAS